jgi:hypothetical protein
MNFTISNKQKEESYYFFMLFSDSMEIESFKWFSLLVNAYATTERIELN